jgi:hypothetical protein
MTLTRHLVQIIAAGPGIRGSIPSKKKSFHTVQTEFKAHSASYRMDTEGSYTGDKAPSVDVTLPRVFIGPVLSYLSTGTILP